MVTNLLRNIQENAVWCTAICFKWVEATSKPYSNGAASGLTI